MDPTPIASLDPEQLLTHDAFVRRLARELLAVGGPAARASAEDVAQQTWVAALERGPRDAATLRGWLATVVRRLAARSRVSAARRLAREQTVATRLAVATPATDDYVEREQLRRRVVDELFALAEPYRATLLLRFLDELPPRAVAARMGVPVETVRTRTRRGLEQVRAQLRGKWGDDERSWGAALAQLASLAGIGAGAMTAKQLGIGVAAVLLGTAAWWSVGAITRSPQVPPEEVVALAAPALVPPDDRPVAARTPAEVPARAAVAPDAVAVEPSGSLLVHVVDARAAPLAGMRVVVEPAVTDLPFGAELHAFTDETGDCRFARLPVGRTRASCSNHGAYGEVRAGEEGAIVVRVDRDRGATYAVEGKVIDEHGSPVAGAAIWSNLPEHPFRAELVATSGDDGTFRFEGAENGPCAAVSARKAGFVDALAKSLNVAPNVAVAAGIVLTLAPGGGALQGVVCDGAQRPLADALVLVGSDLQYLLPIHFDESGRISARVARSALTDGEGRFALNGLPLGAAPLLVRKAGYAVVNQAVTIAEHSPAPLRIELSEGAELEGFVIGVDGEPVPGASVQHGSPLQYRSTITTTDRDGRYRLRGLPAGRVTIRALASTAVERTDLARAIAEVELVAGERHDLDLELDVGAPIAGRVVDGDGAPVARLKVVLRGRCKDPVDPSVFALAETDRAGRFAFEHLLDGRYDLEFGENGAGFGELAQHGIAPGGPELDLRLGGSAVADAWIEGRLLDRGGRAPNGAQLFAQSMRGAGSRMVAIDAATGAFAAGPLVAGDYLIALLLPGRPDAVVPVAGLAAGERRKLDDWVVPDGARLTVRAIGPSELLAAAAEVKVRAAQGFAVSRVLAAGEAVIEGLSPGDYTVRIDCGAAASESLQVTIDEGRDQVVTLALRPAIALVLRFALPDRARDPMTIPSASVENEGGEMLAQVLLPDLPGATFDWPLALAPGRYTLRAYVDPDQPLAQPLVIAADAPAGQVIEVRVP